MGPQMDSQQHLFYECFYPKQVLDHMKNYSKLNEVSDNLQQVVSFMEPRCRGRAVSSVFRKLTLAATIYYIWQEWNLRHFQKKVRSTDQLINFSNKYMKLWLKLICFKFKDTVRVREIMQLWQRYMMEGTMWKGKLIARSVAKFLGESSGQGECVLKHMVVWCVLVVAC